MPWPVIVIALLFALGVVRLLVLRHLAGSPSAFAWVFFGPLLIVPVAAMWFGIADLSSQPVAGVLLIAMGLVYGAVVIKLTFGLQRDLPRPGGLAAWMDRTFTQMGDVLVAVTSVALIAGVVGVGVLIVAVLIQGHP